jgi:hypothetical protein
MDKTLEKILKERYSSLDLEENGNRLDLNIIKNMDISGFSLHKKSGCADTFDSIDSNSRGSFYSSPR